MHKPQHLREALLAWLAEPGETVAVPGEPEPWDIDRLLRELWSSTDTVPSDACQQVGLPAGCTYGHLVRLIAWAHEDHVPPDGDYAAATETLRGLDERQKRAMFDAISDLLRAEDHARAHP